MKIQGGILLSAFALVSAFSTSAMARNVEVHVQAARIVEIAIQEKRIPASAKWLLGKDSAPIDGEQVRTLEVSAKAWRTTQQVGQNLTDAEACERAAVEALGKLFRQSGDIAGQVIGGIVSQWQGGAEFSDAAQLECRAGSYSVGIGLRATLYRVR